MEPAQQQLPTVPADTSSLLSELEQLAVKVRPTVPVQEGAGRAELVIRGK